ncbi:hypothetical protein [Tissierella simiarum]|nr:hypothetical protein [Tissierella simiarum]
MNEINKNIEALFKRKEKIKEEITKLEAELKQILIEEYREGVLN